MCRNSKKAEGCDDGGLGDHRLLQWNLQVTILQVQGAEDSAAFELAREISQVGHWVLVCWRGEVKAAEGDDGLVYLQAGLRTLGC